MKKVVKTVTKTGKMVLAGLQVIGGAMQVAAGAALMSTGVGSVLGALVLAHGVNSMISGAADGYYAATNQNEKMGTVNFMRDGYKFFLGKDLGEKVFNATDFVLGFVGGGAKNAATHADDLIKGLGKILDDIPTAALKPSTATNAGRNLTESGTKVAGRVSDAAEDGLEKVAGKSSSVSRNVDEGSGNDVVAKSPSKPDKSNVVNMSEYKAAKQGKIKPETVDEPASDNVINFSERQANRGKNTDENLNFGKTEKTNVQDLDSKQEFNTNTTNEKSVEIQTKEPVEMPKAVGAEFDPIDFPKKNNLELVFNNGPVSMKKGSDVVASAGGRMDSAVDGIPASSGVSRGTSSAGKIPTEGNSSLNRTEALNKAKDRAGIPRSQQASRQWTVGDDITKKGANFKNYEYSDNPTHHGRYYEYETSQGKRIVVDHTNDVEQGLHTHAGTVPKGADQFKYDFKNPDNRYYPINKDTDHHIRYSG